MKNKITYIEETKEFEDGGTFEDFWDHLRSFFFLWELRTLFLCNFKRKNEPEKERLGNSGQTTLLSWELGCNVVMRIMGDKSGVGGK